LGGRPTPGIGFGIGIDRTVLVAEEQEIPAPAMPAVVAVISPHGGDLATRLEVAAVLRTAGIAVRPDGSNRKLGRQLETAAKVGARWAVIVQGGADDPLILRDLESGEQQELRLSEVPGAIGS